MNPLPKSILCRLCLYRSDFLIDIFDENGKHGYVAAEVIEDLLQLHVKREDGYPQQVCTKCLDKLTDFKVFKIQCYDSQVTFDKEINALSGSTDNPFPSISLDSKGLVAAAEETVTDDYFPQKETHGHFEVKVEKIEADDDTYDVDGTEGIAAEVVIKTESLDCDEAFSQSIVGTRGVEDGMVSSQVGNSGTYDATEVGRIRVRDLWGAMGQGIQGVEEARFQGSSSFSRVPTDLNVCTTRYTSPKQREVMVELIEDNKEVFFKMKKGDKPLVNRKELWQFFAPILNAVPYGAKKSWDKWFKSYQDWRGEVRAKALYEYRSHHTSSPGAPGKVKAAPLTPMEKRLLALINENELTSDGVKKVLEDSADSTVIDSASPRSDTHSGPNTTSKPSEASPATVPCYLTTSSQSNTIPMSSQTIISSELTTSSQSNATSEPSQSAIFGGLSTSSGSSSEKTQTTISCILNTSSWSILSPKHTNTYSPVLMSTLPSAPMTPPVSEPSIEAAPSKPQYVIPPSSQLDSPAVMGTKKRKLEGDDDGAEGSSGLFVPGEQPPREEFVCPQCGKSFAYLCYMNKHIRTTHNRELCERKHECEVCKMRFAKRGNLERHSMVHKGVRSFSCERCGKAFFHRSDLQAHINSHVKVSPFTCDYCQKGFADKLHIIEHINRHTGQKPFPCTNCGKQFGSVKNLKLHEKIHEPNPTYRCVECNKTFTNRIYFLGHQRKHSGELFGCLECGKTFVHKYSLKQHEALHREDGGFTCEVCGKKFDKKNHLRVHTMLHTGERPYECEYCTKRFHVASHLRVHLKLHTGERSFYCDFCGKGFVQKSHYVDHVRVHTGERPFACTECNRAFCQRQQLRQHMKTHNKGRALRTSVTEAVG